MNRVCGGSALRQFQGRDLEMNREQPKDAMGAGIPEERVEGAGKNVVQTVAIRTTKTHYAASAFLPQTVSRDVQLVLSTFQYQ